MARVLIVLSVILISVYVTEQAYFLEKDFINEINEQATTWKISNASTSVFNSMQLNENVENETDSSDNDEISDTKTSSAQEETQLSPLKKKRRGKINFISQKLAGALDRCKLSVRDSVYVLQATLEALGFDNDDYIINSTSIHRARELYRSERAKMIKSRFQESRPSYVIVHWDGKLLPNIHVKNTTVERLPIIVTSKNIEQIIGVPILQRSTGEEQATAVYNALNDWGLLDVVQGLCCDTTSSNTGRLNGACILIEKKLEKDLLYLPCRHHIYELVLRSVFETKIPQVTTSPSIPLFKNFQKKWIDIDSSNFISGLEDQYCSSAIENIREDILNFVRSQLEIKNSRDDYNEFLELVLIFIGGNFEKKIKIHPPGAMHQARWMARAIYCLKIFIFRHQYHISATEKKAIGEVCIFIVKFYVKAWFTCTLPIKAPSLDLQFIKSLKSYEIVDRQISTAAIKKLCNHLWYLTEEAAALSFFDESIPFETKQLMVKALEKKSSINSTKRLTLQPYQIDEKFNEMNIDKFISENSLKLFTRFGIDTSFLQYDPKSWDNHISFVNGKELIKSLKIVNDTAERGVKLMADFNEALTVNEEQKQYVLQCVQEHRQMYPNCKKETLKKLY